MVYTDIKYKKSLKLFDKPIGKMRIENISHGVVILKIEIEFNEKIVASGEQRCVLMNLKTGKIDKRKIYNSLIIY